MEVKRIKMIKTLAGPMGSKISGQFYTISVGEADDLIAGKAAVVAPLKEKKEKAVDHTVAEREKAVAPEDNPQEEPEKPQEESQEAQDATEEPVASGHASLPNKGKGKKGKGKKGA